MARFGNYPYFVSFCQDIASDNRMGMQELDAEFPDEEAETIQKCENFLKEVDGKTIHDIFGDIEGVSDHYAKNLKFSEFMASPDMDELGLVLNQEKYKEEMKLLDSVATRAFDGDLMEYFFC